MFIWTKPHEKALQQIKAFISKETTLADFDPTRSSHISGCIWERLRCHTFTRWLGSHAYIQIPNTIWTVVCKHQRWDASRSVWIKRFCTYIYRKSLTVEKPQVPLKWLWRPPNKNHNPIPWNQNRVCAV